MNKLFAVLKREYLQAVRKKSFLIMTILAPFLMAALMFVPSLLAMKGMGEKKVAVARRHRQARGGDPGGARGDGPGRTPAPGSEDGRDGPPKSAGRRGQILPSSTSTPSGSDAKAAAKPYLERLSRGGTRRRQRLDGVLLIPADVFDDPRRDLTYYSRSADRPHRRRRSSAGVVNTRARSASGSPPGGSTRRRSRAAPRDGPLDSVQVTKSGEEKKGGELTFLVGFLFVTLLFIPSLVYGQEVMRGVIQEKTDRIVEILVSSMSPMELLSGKILGMAAVGLTQLAIWIAMAAVIAAGRGARGAGGRGRPLAVPPAVGRRLLRRLLPPRLPDLRLHLRHRRGDRELREGGAAVLTPIVFVLMSPGSS